MKRIAVLCSCSALLGAVLGQQLFSPQGVTPEARAQAVLAPAASPAPTTPEEETNIRVYEVANPSVVNINTRSVQIVADFFPVARRAEGSGSGAVIDRLGHIVTNFHVIEDAEQIQVTFASNNTYPAQGRGGRQAAGHRRAEGSMPPPTSSSPSFWAPARRSAWGSGSTCWETPSGSTARSLRGIISSLNRNLPSRVANYEMKSIIQTDAAMNPGNSGGPLLDTSGRMIGMCVAIATRSGDSAGIGFAIPIDRVRSIVPELIEHGRVVRADIGIVEVMETSGGLVPVRLVPGGPADKAGLRGWRVVVKRMQQNGIEYQTRSIDRSFADRILAMDGVPMRSGSQFINALLQHKPGDMVTLTILREGEQRDLDVKLGAD